jgi:D-alanine-D-alanine ligase-like ATP-grasp enzyme
MMRVALFHQAMVPPVIDGVVKPFKPGGYRDSCADIVYCLWKQAVTAVVAPSPIDSLDASSDDGWSFPDSKDGILKAIEAGANVLWMNTLLFSGHPLQLLLQEQPELGKQIRILGQPPNIVHKYDDKMVLRHAMQSCGLAEFLCPAITAASGTSAAELEASLQSAGMKFPIIIKPLRGRGSQGVTFCNSVASALVTMETLAAAESIDSQSQRRFPMFGSRFLLEQFIAGDEYTFTLVPGGSTYPPVLRTGHVDGVMPYSGDIPVTANSRVLSTNEIDTMLEKAQAACQSLVAHIGCTAVVRIDGRREHSTGPVYLFDVNFKPNATGDCRPGRESQLNLCALAGRQLGMSYAGYLRELLQTADFVDVSSPGWDNCSS